MKLEAGKYYKTRNGQKAKCVAVWTDEYKGYQTSVMLPEWELPVHYSLSGKFYADENGSDEDDIVSEWQTESRPFRVGDVTTTRNGRKARIICVDLDSSRYTVVAAIRLNETSEERLVARTSMGKLYNKKETPLDLLPLYDEKETP